MGSFCAVGGLSDDAYRLAHAVLGRRPGGLAYATIAGCAGFGSVSPSSLATAATIGAVALPEMKARGYSAQLATGCVAAGGTLGMLVPPSNMMVIYAFMAEVPIGDMFVASLVPSVLATLFYMLAVYAQVLIRPDLAPPGVTRVPRAEVRRALIGVWQVVLLLVIVIGGLYAGVFTATESAAIGTGIAFLFALFRGRLTWQALWEVLADAASNTAMLYLLVFAAAAFSQFVTLSLLPSAVIDFFQSLQWPQLAVVFLILLVYLFLGCIMDPITMLLITIPVVLPVIVGFDMDLVWWGMVTILVIEIGLITPPVGMNVFIIKGVAGPDVSLTTVFRGIMPFLAANLVKLVLLTLFPVLTLWLVRS
jgi:tripartite ATP-independent transporter DctM subunit